MTLERADPGSAWGFSCSGGLDLEQWGALVSGDENYSTDKTFVIMNIAGVSARCNERGLWLSVASVRDESSASNAGLKSGDFITSVNGRKVFHLNPEDVSRLIRNSGKILYLDIERNNSKNLLYCNGLHQFSYNFLFEDNWEMKKPYF